MKAVVIIAVLAALIGGGGFAAVTFVPTMVPVPIRNLLGIEVSEAEQAESDKPSHTILIDIEPLTIPLFANGTVDRFLVMNILLEVERSEERRVGKESVSTCKSGWASDN